MNKETIGKAAKATLLNKEIELGITKVVAFQDGFIAGAHWRINSVWNSYSTKPDKGKLLIVEDIDSAYELVYLTKSKPWEELSEKNHYIRWAYVADLLPDEKDV